MTIQPATMVRVGVKRWEHNANVKEIFKALETQEGFVGSSETRRFADNERFLVVQPVDLSHVSVGQNVVWVEPDSGQWILVMFNEFGQLELRHEISQSAHEEEWIRVEPGSLIGLGGTQETSSIITSDQLAIMVDKLINLTIELSPRFGQKRVYLIDNGVAGVGVGLLPITRNIECEGVPGGKAKLTIDLSKVILTMEQAERLVELHE